MREVTFILVRPLYAGNIGAAARAIKNMGFSKLRIVQPRGSREEPEARKFAMNAADVLKKAVLCETVEESLKGIQIVLGTSCRTGKRRRGFVELPDLRQTLKNSGRIGILFGPEEKGLTNEELALCHKIISIPSSPRYRSLNLAQAVMLVAYELRGFKEILLPENLNLAPADQVEGMYHQLEETLEKIGFFPHGNPFMVMRTLRQLFARSGLTNREVRVLRGICRQILWKKNSKN